jgi:carbohydrate diacid regulator
MLDKYAQEISDTTAQIIGYHVLVTDRDGLITGSSDPERLGQMLNEVPEVVRTRRGYIVSEEEAERVKNTRAGVTYPVEDVDGRIVGTIAITGDPEKVDPFALIVQKQAEMYLREKAFLENALYKERTVQTFLEDVLSYDPRVSGKEKLEQRGREFGFDRRSPYTALYIRYEMSRKVEETEQLSLYSNRLLSLVRQVFSGAKNISAMIAEKEIVLFLALGTGYMDEDAMFRSIADKCFELDEQCSALGVRMSFGVGSPVFDIAGWGRSFREARNVLAWGRALSSSEKVFMVRDHRLHELIASADKDLKSRFAARKLDLINGEKDSGDLKETIMKWCECNFVVRDTAKALHIHRNTLHYRIEKIQRICGSSMRDFMSMMELYIALQLEKLDLAEPSV